MYINIFIFASLPLFCFSMSESCILAFVSRFCYDGNYSGKVFNFYVSCPADGEGQGVEAFI